MIIHVIVILLLIQAMLMLIVNIYIMMLVCGFGEKVHFKISTDNTRKNKMDTEWDVGYFVGLSPGTTEYLIATEMGIISCATMRRMPDEMAYDKKCLEIVKVGYRDYVCEGASSTNPRIRMALPMPKNYDPAPMSEPAVPRRMRIRPEDLQQHGYTIGCPGCEAVQTGSSIRRNHTEECRTRMEEAMAQSQEGKARMEKNKDRLDFNVAKIVKVDINIKYWQKTKVCQKCLSVYPPLLFLENQKWRPDFQVVLERLNVLV